MVIFCRVEPDLETLQPTDQLSPPVRRWAARVLRLKGGEAELGKMDTVEDFLSHPRLAELKGAIHKAIQRANQRSEFRAGRVQKFTLLDKEVSVAGGELGPTLKLKRFFVHKKYKDVIDRMYEEGEEVEE